MIFVTGDCHSDIKRFNANNFNIQKELTKEDYVIICGDFGLVWEYNAESSNEKYWLDWLNSKNFTTLFVDGNHENFDRLNNYNVEEWNGGKVHKIRPSVIHLMRGEIYTIDGLKIFAFGGASSHDISDGILQMDEKRKIHEYNLSFKNYRVEHLSWWKNELPTKEEMDNGITNLNKANYNVDYVISHCAPTSIQSILGEGLYTPDILTDYLQEIYEKLNFKKWYFGHYHVNRNIDDKFKCLYTDIIPLDNSSLLK